MGNAVVCVGVVKKPGKDLATNQYFQTEDFLVWANQCNQLNAIQSHAVSQSNSLKFSLSITIDLFNNLAPRVVWWLLYCYIGCKNTYPKGYWKTCQKQFGSCNQLKQRGKCNLKWSDILKGKCKNQVPAWPRSQLVKQYCKKTCPGCSKKIISILFHYMSSNMYIILIQTA